MRESVILWEVIKLGLDAVAKPNSGGVRTHIPAPTIKDHEDALKLYTNLRPSKYEGTVFKGPKGKPNFVQRTKTLLANGGVTREKLMAFFQLEKMTPEFYALFTGGQKITYIHQLKERMALLVKTQNAFGLTARMLAESDNLIGIPVNRGSALFRGMDIKSLLSKNPTFKQDFDTARALNRDSATTFDKCKGSTKDIFAALVLGRLSQKLTKKGYPDVRFNLRDVLGLSKFRKMFQAYATSGTIPSKDAWEGLVNLQSSVADFRAWMGSGDKTISPVDIDRFDQGNGNLEKLLDNYKSWGEKGVIAFLQKHKNTRVTPVGAKPGKAPVKPAGGKAIQPRASLEGAVFHFQIRQIKPTVANV